MTNEEFIKSITLEGEEWKDIPKFEGIYACSNYGRIFAYEREWTHNGHIRKKNARLLNVNTKSKNISYQIVNLYHKGKQHLHAIHRIVATLFVLNPNNYPFVDHIDCNPKNNIYSNLRWVTYTMNNNNPITKERISSSHTGQYNNKIMSTPVVQLMENKLIHIYPSTQEAQRNGYWSGHICKCCKGKALTHKGYKWMYLSDYENLINKSKNSTIQKDND